MAIGRKKVFMDGFSAIVGAEIAELRRQKIWSGKQLGEAIGVSQQQISRYESGTCEITTSTLCLLLYHLETSLDIFFYRVALRLDKKEPSFYDGLDSYFKHKCLGITQTSSRDIFKYFEQHK